MYAQLQDLIARDCRVRTFIPIHLFGCNVEQCNRGDANEWTVMLRDIMSTGAIENAEVEHAGVEISERRRRRMQRLDMREWPCTSWPWP